jgi:hypothetical protein
MPERMQRTSHYSGGEREGRRLRSDNPRAQRSPQVNAFTVVAVRMRVENMGDLFDAKIHLASRRFASPRSPERGPVEARLGDAPPKDATKTEIEVQGMNASGAGTGGTATYVVGHDGGRVGGLVLGRTDKKVRVELDAGVDSLDLSDVAGLKQAAIGKSDAVYGWLTEDSSVAVFLKDDGRSRTSRSATAPRVAMSRSCSAPSSLSSGWSRRTVAYSFARAPRLFRAKSNRHP